MSVVSAGRVLRRNAKWLLLVAVLGFAVFRLKFAPVPVMAHRVEFGPIVAEVMGTGTLEARVQTTISPRIQERLAEVLVDQNDSVKAGQVLARLDDGELKQQVGVAEAALASAQATSERVRVDEMRAQAVEHQARLDHQRTSRLLTNQISSQADLDKAVEQLKVASAELKRAQAAILEAESQVVTARKNLAYQQERLTYTRILSPYDGLVVKRDRDPGGVVVPGGSLLRLISTNEIWVSAWVDETAMGGLATGQTARIVFRSEPTNTYAGTVARLGRETDRETREFLVDIRLLELPRNWAVGQRAEAFIATAQREKTAVVPRRFLRWLDGRPGVFVRERGRAKWRAVTLGLSGPERVEVKQGLSAGEEVIRPALARQELSEGQRVGIGEAGPGQQEASR
jgi:RND family efflux transporter MFP subunit